MKIKNQFIYEPSLDDKLNQQYFKIEKLNFQIIIRDKQKRIIEIKNTS